MRLLSRLFLEGISKPILGRAKLLLSLVFPQFRLGGSLALPVLKPPLVLQRLFWFPTSPSQFFATTFFVTLACDAISFHAPIAPGDDFVFVPLTQVEQMPKNRSDFWHGHLRFFFPPAGVSEA